MYKLRLAKGGEGVPPGLVLATSLENLQTTEYEDDDVYLGAVAESHGVRLFTDTPPLSDAEYERLGFGDSASLEPPSDGSESGVDLVFRLPELELGVNQKFEEIALTLKVLFNRLNYTGTQSAEGAVLTEPPFTAVAYVPIDDKEDYKIRGFFGDAEEAKLEAMSAADQRDLEARAKKSLTPVVRHFLPDLFGNEYDWFVSLSVQGPEKISFDYGSRGFATIPFGKKSGEIVSHNLNSAGSYLVSLGALASISSALEEA